MRTPWNDVAAGSVSASGNGNGSGQESAGADPYAAYKDAVTAAFGTATHGPLARFSSSAEDVGGVIARAVAARRPRTRYLINPVARITVTLRRWIPDRAYDAVLRRQYHLPS